VNVISHTNKTSALSPHYFPVFVKIHLSENPILSTTLKSHMQCASIISGFGMMFISSSIKTGYLVSISLYKNARQEEMSSKWHLKYNWGTGILRDLRFPQHWRCQWLPSVLWCHVVLEDGAGICSSETLVTTWHHNPINVVAEWQSFVFRRSRVQISAQGLAILTEVFRGFPQSLQENSRIVPYIRPWPLPSTTFPIHYSPIILSFDAA
jgi:hypothetical protein